MKYDIQFKKDLEKSIDARNPLDHGREGYFYIHKLKFNVLFYVYQ